ncbi:type IV pilin protein [Sulfurospirillum sp. 1612]|uniref:type IV pilin protein n=1 Tax=Sulfurospirillum sp. 1612 TaxID=3094835 RepID=UPI002F9573DB
MRKKPAFTMIELVMVIVVLGIVASIGAEIIVKLYDNYIKTRAINRLQAQSDLVLNEIAQRLQFRIKDSIIARDTDSAGTPAPHYVSLTDANDSYQILEWIGYDNESFRGVNNPGWSGFIDLNNATTNKALGAHGKLKTIGSDLNTTDQIIGALSNGKVRLDNSVAANRPALIFNGQSNFDVSQYGWNGTKGEYTYKVSYTSGANDVLNFDQNTSALDEIFEHYYLAWSAYSVVPEGSNSDDFNLTLHYNYQPWEDEKYDDTNTSKAILCEHVSTFKFTKIGDTIRLKLCIRDGNQSGNYDFAFCKEKVVY